MTVDQSNAAESVNTLTLDDVRAMPFEDYLAAVRTFAHEVLIPAEADVERLCHIPDDVTARLRAMGLFGITLPRNVGGLGWTMEEQVRLTFEFTQASAVFRSRFSTTIGLCSQMLLDFGTQAQKDAYLRGMAEGRVTAAFCLTERDIGSDAGNIETTARRDGDDFVLNGIKRYITNGPDADLFVVMARSDPDKAGNAGISVFLIDKGTPGLSVGEPEVMLGQRGSRVSEVYLNDCRVPAERLLGGQEGDGLKRGLRGINHARTHVAATAVGQAVRILEETVAYTRQRHQFGQPIGDFQAIQTMLGESQAELVAARALVVDVARKFDTGTIPHIEIAAAKLFATEMVGRVADRAVQILGGMGYMESHPVAKLFRDVRLLRIFEGTSQIHQINIAKNMARKGVIY